MSSHKTPSVPEFVLGSIRVAQYVHKLVSQSEIADLFRGVEHRPSPCRPIDQLQFCINVFIQQYFLPVVTYLQRGADLVVELSKQSRVVSRQVDGPPLESRGRAIAIQFGEDVGCQQLLQGLGVLGQFPSAVGSLGVTERWGRVCGRRFRLPPLEDLVDPFQCLLQEMSSLVPFCQDVVPAGASNLGGSSPAKEAELGDIQLDVVVVGGESEIAVGEFDTVEMVSTRLEQVAHFGGSGIIIHVSTKIPGEMEARMDVGK